MTRGRYGAPTQVYGAILPGATTVARLLPAAATVTGTPTQVPPTATATATPTVVLGDVDGNGVVDSTDALWVLWLEALLAEPGDIANPDALDVNGDGIVNAIDALFILWIELGLV